MTKTFHDPEGFLVHSKMLDKEMLKFKAEMSKNAEEVEYNPRYYPLAPEMWKNSVAVLGNFPVIKFPRVL